MKPQDKIRAATGHLINAKRSLNEAIEIGVALQRGEELPERHEAPVSTFRPVSPNRDRSRFVPAPDNPMYMKPSRLAKRGRHGSRRRR